jgi:hypothetical protein
VQAAAAGKTLNDGGGHLEVINNTGLFLQDSWKLSSGLQRSQRACARSAERARQAPQLPMPNVAKAKVAGSVNGNTGVTPKRRFRHGQHRHAGRQQPGAAALGLQLEPGHARARMQLRGGAGLFQGAAANVWLSNPFSNTGMAVATLNCGPLFDCLAAPTTGSHAVQSQPGCPAHPDGHAPAANVDFLSLA